MRDTIILVSIVGAIVIGIVALKRTQGLGPTLPAMSTKATSQNSKDKVTNNHMRGEHNEGTTHSSSFKTRNSRADEGSASNTAETESLSSIYPKESFTGSAGSTPGLKRPGVNHTTAKKKAPVIAGVPVDAYVASKRNSLSLPDVEETRPEGLRVFLMCSELKQKKLNPVNQRDCNKLYREIVKR